MPRFSLSDNVIQRAIPTSELHVEDVYCMVFLLTSRIPDTSRQFRYFLAHGWKDGAQMLEEI